ncbi:anti-sigma factor [Nocardioides sp.]|uniref:anti-sigma factor n=1 Tax=Nocardioides sp. TaxID=35761 RepID=UPI002615E4D1|nr:anti-sigma factor [Nocardioides sp.]MCW2736722.1 anti-sigma factor [Nocardioides sp.]
MTHVDLDDLAALVLTPDESPADVRRHVDSCADCRATAAALSDVRRLAGEEPLVPASARVRELVLAEVRSPVPSDDGVVRAVPLPVAATPEASRSRVPVWAAGLAAGIALVVGLGLGRLTADDESVTPEAQPTDAGAVVAAADLTALDSDADRGVARAVREDDMVTLRVSARELGDEDGFHEVWLINVDGTRMVALGVLAEGDTGEFQVPRGLIEEGYRIVDISVEPDDGDPTHSGVSLARGELA